MSDHDIVFTTPPPIPPRTWNTPVDTAALAHMKRLREDAAKKLQEMQNTPPELSPLEAAQADNVKLRTRVAELEKQVATLTAELAAKGSPHLRVEKR